MSALVAWRALLFKRFDLPSWEVWLFGAVVLLAAAAVLRRWARYELTTTRLVVRNGYTGRIIAERPLIRTDRVEVRQGPIARLLGLGTVAVMAGAETAIRFRGLREPDEVKARVERLLAANGSDPRQVPGVPVSGEHAA